MTGTEFVERLAGIAAERQALHLPDTDGYFASSLRVLNRDATDYLATRWKSTDHAEAPVERAVEVLVEDIIVLIHHAPSAGINHPLMGALIIKCIEATQVGVIVDPHHREFFEAVAKHLPQPPISLP